MPLASLKTSLLAKATLLLAILMLICMVRTASVAAMSWVGVRHMEAVDAVGALQVEIGRLARRAAWGESPEGLAPLIAAVDFRLRDEPLLRALQDPAREPLRVTFQQMRSQWTGSLRGRLRDGAAGGSAAELEAFARAADHLALGLRQEHHRHHVLDLRFLVATGLAIPLLYLLAYFYFRRRVARPLQQLLAATEQFRAGQFDVRLPRETGDEIGRLVEAFNAMADTIGTSHRNLEGRVEKKMQRLAQANAALELLFRSSRSVASRPLGAAALDDLISRFQALLPGLQLTLCLEPGASGRLIALHGDAEREICTSNDCGTCPRHLATDQQIYEVRSQGLLLGKLRARFPEERASQDWESDLLQALADLVGNALMVDRQREQRNQLLLHGERAVIARELHDSLAQSLSYLKLQISSLQALLRQGEPAERVVAVSDDLREGVAEAYRQLRELLTTFRLGMNGGELAGAMKEGTEEFSQRGGFRVTLETEPLAAPLAASEQIDVLQIMREALANCARHAHAECVSVTLRQAGEDVELVIDDDGQGVSIPHAGRLHHGISIMQERAANLGGALEVMPLAPRGTRVRLVFRPVFFTTSSQEGPCNERMETLDTAG